MKHLTHIEPLESRIAPATIVNPYTVTYQNTTGDMAIVTISKPLFTNATTAGNILHFVNSSGTSITESFTGNNSQEFLSLIDLLGRTDASGMNISVKAIPQVGVGSLNVGVGEILAANFPGNNTVTENISLGSVYIQGNLGAIAVGSNIVSTPALRSLTVGSMTTGVESIVLGTISSMSVQGDFNANLNLIGYQFGSIGRLYIGGSLAGDSAGDAGSGEIYFQGHIGSATIGKITGSSVSGASNNNTGELTGEQTLATSIGSLTVLGSIKGGSGSDSGRVFAETSIGKLTVDGSVMGSSGNDSGEIAGPVKTVNILGGLAGGSGISSGSILGETLNSSTGAIPVAIGSVTIGGNVTGGNAGVAAVPASGSTAATAAVPGDSGFISAFSARSINIAGSLIGGTAGSGTNSNGTVDQTADTSGTIQVDSANSITIGNNIVGGSGPTSGVITGLADFAAVHYSNIVVNGSVEGGSGATSGSILAGGVFGGTITNLHIGTNLVGSSGSQSGEVIATTSLGTLFIGGNLIGGSAESATALVDSGYIQSGHIGTLTIKGNVTSGGNSGGEIANSGAIRSSGDILSLNIGGTVTGTSAYPVVISAEQGLSKSAHPKTDVAIQNVTIHGAVDYLDLLAGYSPTVSKNSDPAGAPLGTPVDGSAQIGTVSFGSTLSASNVVAGVEPDATTGFFGTAGNTAIAMDVVAGVQSSIASIIVAGKATGDSTPTDSYGFVAEQLNVVKVNGTSIETDNLTPGVPAPVNSTNLYLLEVS